MKLVERTIPTEFIKLDDTVTDADRFVNIRDLHIARLNHNIALANAPQRIIGYRCIKKTFTALYPLITTSPEYATMLARLTAKVSPYAKEYKAYIRCLLTQNTGDDIAIFGHTRNTKTSRPNDYPQQTLCTSTAYAWYEVTIYRHRGITGKNEELPDTVIDLYMTHDTLTLPAKSAAVPITAVTSDNRGNILSVSVATAGLAGTEAIGDMLADSSASFESRSILSLSAGGGTTVITPSRPWAKGRDERPAVADNIDISGMPALTVDTVVFAEVEPTGSFDVQEEIGV